MGKLVVYKFGEGDFEHGFPVTLQIGEDGDRPSIEITGRLSKAPDIPQAYSRWRLAYCSLGLRYRLEAEVVQVTNVSVIDDCYNSAQKLCDSLNAWLHSESFRPLREKLLEKLMPSDEIRVILQTENTLMQRLPWHMCDLLQRYPKSEIALSAPAYERTGQTLPLKSQVKILAILGNSTGINTQADVALLERLPGAVVKFLVEPQRQQLNDQLWSQGWDILFFAGHSSSQADGNSGRIYINKTDSLTISDLKYALQTAVEHGLKLAIFNSCDGLGLARDLAGLHIPQIIVMREPVPDRVAQEFLKYFLQTFASGKPFYLAVREAREKLQGLEDEFPCASWLPVIYQNPAELPLSWFKSSSQVLRDRPLLTSWRSLRKVVLASLITTSLVMGVRHLGILQSLELQAFDHLNQLRPIEGPDPRLLIIKVTEADIQAQNQEPGQGSLSDPALQRLLQKLEKYQPRTIGLDIYRPLSVKPNYGDLGTYMKQSDRFFAVCKASDPATDDIGVAPPPEIPAARLGFSDIVPEKDNIIRRQYIHFNPPLTSKCATEYAFSLLLALHYLNAQKIQSQVTPEGLKVGDVVFKKLKAHTGGYQAVDTSGYQLLLNYRPFRSLEDIALQVTLGDILNDRIPPNLVKDIKDRIVIIGVTAPSASDFWLTPYSDVQPAFQQQTPGVFLQAQMVSQILSAVLDQRSLIWVLPLWGEFLWIWSWSLVGGILAMRWRSPLYLLLTAAVALGILYGVSFAVLTQAGWIPVVPSALALIATTGSIFVYQRSNSDIGVPILSNSRQLLSP